MQIICLGSSSRGNSYVIRTGSGTLLLLEAGLPFPKLRRALQANNLRLQDFDACITSHEHSDHSQALKDVSRLVSAYGSAETIFQRKIIGGAAFTNWGVVYVRNTKIVPFPVNHDVPNFGFLIEDGKDKLFFATDTSLIRFDFSKFQFTHIMIETNYIDDLLEKSNVDQVVKERVKHSHMSLATAIRTLKTFNLKKLQEIYLIHLSSEHSDPQRMFDEVAKIVDPKKIYICQQNGGTKGINDYAIHI